MRTGSITALLLFAAGALALQTAQAQEQYTLTYRLAKDHPYRFRDTTVVTSSQEMMGQEMKSTSTLVSTMRVVPTELKPDGSTVAEVSAEGMMAAVRNARMDTTFTFPDLVGKRSRVTLSKRGETLKHEVVDTVQTSTLAMAAGVGRQEMMRFQVLPDKPVSIGDKWKTVKPDTAGMGPGGQVVTLVSGESTLLGKESHGKHECLKISFTGTLTLTGKGSMNGMQFYLEGNGKSSATYLVDIATGLAIVADSRNDVETTVALTGQQNMTIPGSQSAVTHRLLLED